MAYTDPVRAQQNRLMATDPLRFSPAAREAWRQQRSFEEDRRRFDASEARFREAERNRHAEQAYTNETARKKAAWETKLRNDGRWHPSVPMPKPAPVRIGDSLYDPEKNVVIGEHGGWKLPDSWDDGQKATPFSGLPEQPQPPAPEVPKAPEIVDLGNGRKGYWDGQKWVELSPDGAPAAPGGGTPAPGRDSFGGRDF